jgi:hypothetical protein
MWNVIERALCLPLRSGGELVRDAHDSPRGTCAKLSEAASLDLKGEMLWEERGSATNLFQMLNLEVAQWPDLG